ncbi:SMP-30/gluconolaconase/LRE-like region family protein [Burkholderia sp. Leaf177]|uniref:SMP-30/gluconolactonase/LRE family protein n=1 Tax=Burkholderia sp. Leaf177 TaxID=1736287 RepID=UPI0006F33F2F|nr:SMP-30/gluconolactonase/LRE family protein [Burkholderia sp. Leaf177]KQR84346.1 SMP-30/gluconolaconase/LRE-like region family protein [Burkholderia sp. Leaf177]
MVITRLRTVRVLFTALVLLASIARPAAAQYSIDWVANTYGTGSTYVGNGARSMWIASEGIVYTASLWDENEGGIAIYQNRQNAGSIGIHNEFQGSAITGNATSIFAAMQYDRNKGSGYVGRYNRTTKTQDFTIAVSATTTEKRADVITGLATAGALLYASDFPGNRVRVFTIDGVWQRDINVTGPGALAIDTAGNLWVAQKNAGVILEFSPTGATMNTIQMAATSRPSALYFDPTNGQLMVGDQGPDMNIKLYQTSGSPVQSGTFGIQGGYLDTTSGIKGQVGDRRFTRVVGIGKDAAGNLYVLSNPWGGTWDLARNGNTDIYVYDASSILRWRLQALNFEGNGAPDPGTDGAYLYGGFNVYTGTAGGTFVANTVNPFDYPADPRIDINDTQRGQHFAQLATVGANRIMVAAGQNPGVFNFYHFNAANGYIAIPDGSLPGALFNSSTLITGGFSLDSNANVWAGPDRTNRIYFYPLTGFNADGKPSWGPGFAYATPRSVLPLTRIIYLADSDTLILAQGIIGSADWTSIGTRIEVYHGWRAGNQKAPSPVITLTTANPKSIAAAGNYLFVGYVHSVPNIDAFNLSTGSLDMTFTNSNPGNVDVGNDVDSMYGLRAYLRSTGEYVVTKDNYNESSIIVYRWTPGAVANAAKP